MGNQVPLLIHKMKDEIEQVHKFDIEVDFFWVIVVKNKEKKSSGCY